MEDILDYLQEAAFGLSDLRQRISAEGHSTIGMAGLLANVERLLADATFEVSAMRAVLEPNPQTTVFATVLTKAAQA
ncbi:hypothetical protein GKE82_21000 [Conexibacter sp. W3-3-2]|uniref:hypothetical protein n=1 Tax=Conexibacter sp. W3-3-2 TaxID=2675227 RepID=UPI0012B6E020|nr:hypothetical protein [Conexibacter sp. W3-3-2]MTD46699.1 hypothetical protein [Conexibacter sp. W3-3-2]